MAKAYRAQGRGGRGVSGHLTKDEDEVVMLFPARTLDTILFFTDKGKVYSEKTYQIPDSDRTARGIPIVNILSLLSGETVTAAVAVPKFSAAEYCTMATRKGKIKRVALSEFAAVRPSGLAAITLGEGDELWWARLTHGDSEILLVTERGQAVRFSEREVRSMGRTASGVTAVRLARNDRVASMEVVEEGADLLVITSNGFGKRTPLREYPVKSRATRGVATIDRNSLDKIGRIITARVVQENDDLTIISSYGLVLRAKVKSTRLAGRATRGTRLIVLQEGDRVASVARIADADLRSVGVTPNGERRESDQMALSSDGRGDGRLDEGEGGAARE
jgi:DNA gyrase subunit A